MKNTVATSYWHNSGLLVSRIHSKVSGRSSSLIAALPLVETTANKSQVIGKVNRTNIRPLVKVEIKVIDDSNKMEIRQLFIDNWNSDIMVTKGQIHKFDDLGGFIATDNNDIVGFLTFKHLNHNVELISLNSFVEHKGIGTLLLNRLVEYAIDHSINSLWLMITNDNMNALKFYQKRKWILKNIYYNAVKEARRLKPTIPLIGYDGIEIKDELELEYKIEK